MQALLAPCWPFLLLAAARPGAATPRDRRPQLPAAGRQRQPDPGRPDIDSPVEPASLTKLMTGYLVFDALQGKKIDLKQTLPVSERAWKMPARACSSTRRCRCRWTT
jgi:hypothetical protein